MRLGRKYQKKVFPILALVLVAAYQYFYEGTPTDHETGSDDVARIAHAYAAHSSGIWVTVAGSVVRTLADDNEGSRHQRFIIKLSDEGTVLVAHNIDVARRVPLTRGDRVELRGRYEWNDRGGVIHWTHRDPSGNKQGGWLEHQQVRYR